MRYKYVKIIATKVIVFFFVLQLVRVTKLRRNGTGTNLWISLVKDILLTFSSRPVQPGLDTLLPINDTLLS